MATFIKRWTSGEHLALLLPMVGFKLMWLAALGSSIYNLFKPEQYDSSGYQVTTSWVNWDTYIVLSGITALNLGSLYGRKQAIKAKPSQLTTVARGFTMVTLVISLVVGGIFGIANFMSNLNSYTGATGILRAVNDYLPILLVAGLLIFVILKAFVGSKGEGDE